MAAPASTPRLAVLGGGLLGRLLAWQLAERGWAITLFEQGPRDGSMAAAHVAAAMLAPLAEAAEAAPAVLALGWRSLSLWPQLLARLPQTVFFQQNGTVVLWHGQDRPLARQFVQRLPAGGPAAQHWDAAQLAAQEPQLAGRFQAACYLPHEGQLDGRQLLQALASALAAAGVDCRWQQPAQPADVAAAYDWCIDCRGLGARADWNRQTRAAPLRGVRGEVARVRTAEVALQRPVRLLHPRYPLYIAPKQDGLFVVGATQLESDSKAPVRVRSALELLSALYTVHPAFGEAEILALETGLRPVLEHHRPEIRYDRRQRCVAINGLYRHGFMIAPAVVEAALALINSLCQGRTPPADDYGIVVASPA